MQAGWSGGVRKAEVCEGIYVTAAMMGRGGTAEEEELILLDEHAMKMGRKCVNLLLLKCN